MTILHIGKVEKKFAAEQLYTGFFLLVFVYNTYRLEGCRHGDGCSALAQCLSPNFIVDKDTFTYAKVRNKLASLGATLVRNSAHLMTH